MSSEVCPFCGKTYKRLKSHLPHCKAAASSRAPPTTQDVAATQKPASHPAAAVFRTTSKGKKSEQMSSVATYLPSERSKKGSVASLKPVHSATPDGSSPSSVIASSSPTSKKKKKQSLGDQIITTAPSTSSPSPLSSTLSKPKKKSLRALIEAAKSEHIAKETLTGNRSASEDLSLSRTSDQTEAKAVPDSFKDISVASALAETKANKEPKVKDVLLTTKYTSDFLDSTVNKNNVKYSDWGNEGPVEPGNDHQMRVTLQDVKATLGRAASHRQSSWPSVLSRIAAADSLNSEIRLDTDLGLIPLPAESQKHAVNYLATPTAQSDKQLGNRKQPKELQLFQKISTQLNPTQQDTDRQLEPASACARVQRGTSSSILNESLKVDPHRGLLSVFASPHLLSSHNIHPAETQSLPGMAENFQLLTGKRNIAEKPTEGLPTQLSLDQVRLRELPNWLASRTPRRPRDVVEMVQRGWLWYYRRYIDVKKGGVGGLGMLLAGYCVLSYIWSYPHIKLSRWRKYH
ncbi:PREDICTED: uncharacterized protein C17orf80 homolog [Poecilia mexicana]|uniref:Uncharacterized protein n=1 Tax=Poecilia mexicana TaxID=48701 RepID=A0A3B3WM78_9TELE|nr:PREDICTED: uncharacterized protein C17orf80 homolog [Poecilia mexicana]